MYCDIKINSRIRLANLAWQEKRNIILQNSVQPKLRKRKPVALYSAGNVDSKRKGNI